MYRGKKQPCRNFMRGSCHYGDQCKFLHSTNINQQQQSMPTISSSSSSNNNNNPFGFGKLASQQSKAAPSSSFASVPKQQNQFKPFENKWTRDTNVAKQSNEPQPPPTQPANHICTDPNTCKRLIAEDFQHERPIWKLSCYGHFKYLPCDIKGDISPEELRAAAYDDGKKGMSLLAIVERERNMVNSKLIEYENFLRNPYVISSHTSTFPGVNVPQSPATVQNNVPPPVSSFSQLGMLTNQGSKPSAVVPSSGNFGQQNPFPVTSQTPGFSNNPTFGTQGLFGNQQHGNASIVNTSLGFGNLTASLPNPFQSANVATNQGHMQPLGNVSAFNIPFGNVAVTPTSSSSAASVQSPFVPIGHNAAGENSPDVVHGDMSIWLKEKWSPGEIPEEAPPAGYCF
ncbi:hypothetical protein AQUCO_03100041v1 [Aquilegia coerulea]|uniref:C3H1-type domain-containing protein n=1 Tax=Aquilegia coerulea TaxID=218851 RepID=A0A2G5D0G0_AQUCA|nr:hypothetical protein AQUCO_03100041v1 [Aquilegia coerulea]